MPKIVNIEYNDYERKFISIEVEPNEICSCIPYENITRYSFYPKDLNGETFAIEVVRRHFSTGLTGQTVGYGNTWALGYGSGAAMGWTLGLDLETALNGACAFCNVIETNILVASVYLNIPDNWEAYGADKATSLVDLIRKRNELTE